MLAKRPSAFSDLRTFARHAIPELLRAQGGWMGKQEMHKHIEQQFIGNDPWPDELLAVGKSGCQAKTNAIAWAMSDLVVERVLRRSVGSSIVQLM